jgi:hypothetical protein
MELYQRHPEIDRTTIIVYAAGALEATANKGAARHRIGFRIHTYMYLYLCYY